MRPATVPSVDENPPPMMVADERIKVRSAASLALRLYPGPVGEVLYDELMSWEQFGYRFGGRQLIDRLIKFLDTESINRLKI